jgi:thiol-disulfide isomerase/thioredoxin
MSPRSLVISSSSILLAFLTFLASLAGAAAAHAQCEPSPPVRQILDRYAQQSRTAHFKADREAAAAILLAGLGEHPDDAFLLRARLHALEPEMDPGAQLRWARARHDEHPDRPIYAFLYAEALVGRDTPAARRMLEALAAAHPELPQTWLALARISATGNFRDPAQAQRALASFLERCPAPLVGSALQLIVRQGTPEQVASTAAAVRRRLEAASDPTLPDVWEALWSLEFKARPTTEHEGERQQISRDLARLERLQWPNRLAWLELRRSACGDLGDPAATAKVEAEILRAFPASDTAEWIVRERWEKDHRFAPGQSKESLETHFKEELAAAEAWRRQWPGDPNLLDPWFTALSGTHAPAERIASAADEVLAAAKREPDWMSWYDVPPVVMNVAGELVRRELRLAEIPALVEESYRPALARLEWELADDRHDDQRRQMPRQLTEMLKLERATILLDYSAAVKQPEKAAAVDADLAALEPTKPFTRLQLLELRARAAEMLGHKLDALTFYRAAVEARAAMLPQPQAGKPQAGKAQAGGDPYAQDVDRLWKELGGTDAAHALLAAAPQAATLAETSRWERPGHPLPTFALADLGGKTWKLLDLKGRAVLINVWATWCGPCRQEHPDFQKLYEKLKDRADVAVLSFNVDDDVGRIAPYMNAHRYTFPAIPAREVVNAVAPTLSIPRNWFVDPRGQLQWEQLGFRSGDEWQQAMIAKLDELLAQR